MDFEKNNRRFRIRGVNLGSWLNIEDFMIGLEGTEWQIRRALEERLGDDRASAFLKLYRDCFITREDIQKIAELGFNTVRVPFNYRHFESDETPFHYLKEGFAHLDALYDWCGEAGLWVLLDYHAAPRGQNTTPPADCPTGYNELWQCAHAQERVLRLWEELARRYGDHPANLGYNLLNEPMVNQPGEWTPARQRTAYNDLCRRISSAIRAIDPHGWIIIEGPVRESGGVDTLDLDLFKDTRTAPSYHHYPLYEDSLGLCEERIPAGADVEQHARFLRGQIAAEIAFARRVGRPMLLGEFGLSARWEPRQAEAIFTAQLQTAEEAGFSWLLWTYKDVYRLGLYRPRHDTEWYRLVRGPDMLDAVGGWQRQLDDFVKTTCAGIAPVDTVPWTLRAMAQDDLRRGLNRLILDYQVRQIARLDEKIVQSLPEAFRLDNCERREACWELLRPWLPDAKPSPLAPS